MAKTPEGLRLQLQGEDTEDGNRKVLVMLQLTEPCGACSDDGTPTGVVYNPYWRDWLKALDAEEERMKEIYGDPHPLQTWSKEEERLFEAKYPEPTGPEELPCPECEGTRETLTPAGQQLRTFVLQHCRVSP